MLTRLGNYYFRQPSLLCDLSVTLVPSRVLAAGKAQGGVQHAAAALAAYTAGRMTFEAALAIIQTQQVAAGMCCALLCCAAYCERGRPGHHTDAAGRCRCVQRCAVPSSALLCCTLLIRPFRPWTQQWMLICIVVLCCAVLSL